MVMSLYYVIILCLCYGQVIPRDTSVKLKQCGLRHARTSMDKMMEARLLDRGSMVSDVWNYCCAYVIHVVHVSSVMIVHMQYCSYVVCVHVVYAILCIGC